MTFEQEMGDASSPESPIEEVAETNKQVRHRRYRWVAEWVIIVVVALGAALFMRAYVFQTFFIPSTSMVPTLEVGDRILVSKLSVEFGTINRGDILVFRRPPAESCGGEQVNDLVKRVIGLPGDHLYSKGDTIYIQSADDARNGVPAKPLDQTWTHTEPLGTAVNNVHVPANSYFMMGDNQSYSCDSRYWGPITRDYVVGKVVFRMWPLSRIGFL